MTRRDIVCEGCCAWEEGVGKMMCISKHTLARWRRKAIKANETLWDDWVDGQDLIDDIIRVTGKKGGTR